MSLPKIKYSLIGYGNKILIDYYKKYGEFVQHNTDVIFKKTKKTGSFFWSLHHVDYLYVRESDNIILLLMMETGYNKQAAMNYLCKLKEALLDKYDITTLKTTQKHSLTEFKEDMAILTEEFNSNYTDKTQIVKSEVFNTKNMVVENLKNLLERSNQVDDLEEQVNEISDTSIALMKNANTLRRTTQSQYYKTVCFFILIAVFGLYLLLAVLCGFTLGKCF